MPDDPLKKFHSPGFLDELHHLLWVEPAEIGGRWDEGWNCRNHALIAGAVACAMKERAAIVYGKASYVQGPQGDFPPVGIAAEPHSWFGVDGHGYFDLSPRLTQSADPLWRPWPMSCVAMGRCIPSGEFKVAKDEHEFENLVNSATHIPNCRRAVYLGKYFADLSRKVLTEAFEAADSPLTVRLSEKYEPSIFAKAAVHLFKLLRGEAKSLRDVPQEEAWKNINRQTGDAIGWICMKGGLA